MLLARISRCPPANVLPQTPCSPWPFLAAVPRAACHALLSLHGAETPMFCPQGPPSKPHVRGGLMMSCREAGILGRCRHRLPHHEGDCRNLLACGTTHHALHTAAGRRQSSRARRWSPAAGSASFHALFCDPGPVYLVECAWQWAIMAALLDVCLRR